MVLAFGANGSKVHMNHETQSGDGGWFGSRGSLVLIAFLAFVGFFLLTDHPAHLFGILPYLFLLACPFMHFFMDRGHGKHGNGRTQ